MQSESHSANPGDRGGGKKETSAVAMALVPVTALIIGTPAFADGVVAVFGLHAFFAVQFVGSALLFRRASANCL